MLAGDDDGASATMMRTRVDVDEVVDADQIAIGVDQRTTRVTLVDRRVGLDEIFKGIHAHFRAVQRRNNTHGDALSDVERIANGQNHVTHAQFIFAPCVGYSMVN